MALHHEMERHITPWDQTYRKSVQACHTICTTVFRERWAVAGAGWVGTTTMRCSEHGVRLSSSQLALVPDFWTG